jgi:regulation of enolase protein 1 (concanavalin A-like superfamily)
MIPIDLDSMNWFNPPPFAEMRNGRLCVRSGDKTDFWQGTYYGFHRDDGHFLHQLRRGDFTATVTFTGRYQHLYDQAGLMIRYDATHWIKCGVELTDGAKHFSVVVTNGHSDWSAFKLDHDFAAMSVRVTRNGDAMFIQYSTDRMPARRMARLAYFDPALTDLAIGPSFCSPQREGFEAEFLNFGVTDPLSRDIH